MNARPAPLAEGNLAKTPFAHVLFYVRERRLSGTLAVQSGPAGGELAGESLLLFNQGALAQVRLPRVIDPLGAVLHDLGAITDDALQESLARLAAREGLQGEILVAMGACDAAAVTRGLREQVRRKALRLFPLADAPYQYFAQVDLLARFGRERVAEDVLAVVWRSVRAGPEPRSVETVLSKVGGQALRLRPSTKTELPAFEFDRAEDAVLDVLRCDAATVEELARAGTEPRVARAMVYVLVATKQVEIVPPGAATTTAVPAPATSTSLTSSAPMIAAPADGTWPSRMSLQIPAVRPPETDGAVRNSVPDVRARVSTPPLDARVSAGDNSAAPPAPTPAPLTDSRPTLPRRRSNGLPRRPSAGRGLQGLPPELQEKAAEATARLAAMDAETYFQMLNVPTSASTDAVRAGFMELAARWHPDRVPAAAPALREVYQAIFAHLNEAQATLCDDATRGRYMRTVQDGGGTPHAQRKIGQLIEAATDVQKAEVCLRVRDYAEAERLCRRALAVTSDDPNTLTVLAATLMERPSDESVREAEALLRRAVETAPKHDRAHFLLGTLHKRRGDGARALECFRLAVDANAKNLEAAREVRIAEMRARGGPGAGGAPASAPESPKGGGLLSKLLKR